MPQINDIISGGKTKKFKKKSYRPWDLSGEGNFVSQDQDSKKASLHKETSDISMSSNPLKSKKEGTRDIPSKKREETNTIFRQHQDNIKITSRQQKDNNQKTNSQHKDNTSITLSHHIDNNLDNNDDEINVVQYYMKVIKSLTGLQEKIFFYIVNDCCSRGCVETRNIKTIKLAEIAKCSYGSAKMTIQRLVAKKIIIRLPGKKSWNGFVNFKITPEIRLAALEVQKEKNIDNNLDNKRTYSSSNIYNNKTTTINLPEEWNKINFYSLEEIGFTKTQLLQLYDTGQCIPQGIQESINYLAFDIEYNKLTDKYPHPLNVFMGALRKGKLWSRPKNYESPQEIVLRQLIERKKETSDKLEKLKEEAYKLALSEWQETLNPEQLEEIAPDKKSRGDIIPKNVKLSVYFKENIWPEERMKIGVENLKEN